MARTAAWISLIDCRLAFPRRAKLKPGRKQTLENSRIGIGQLSSGFHGDYLILVTGIVRPIGGSPELTSTFTDFALFKLNKLARWNDRAALGR